MQNRKVMIGKTKLTPREKEILRGLVNFTCEGCVLHECLVGTLHPHRITRGNAGGTYAPSNIKMFCTKCHKAIHAGEFR